MKIDFWEGGIRIWWGHFPWWRKTKARAVDGILAT